MRGKLKTVSGYSQKKFAALETLGDSGDVNRAWDIIRENISAKEIIGYCTHAQISLIRHIKSRRMR
jgi:hypothetical protein